MVGCIEDTHTHRCSTTHTHKHTHQCTDANTQIHAQKSVIASHFAHPDSVCSVNRLLRVAHHQPDWLPVWWSGDRCKEQMKRRPGGMGDWQLLPTRGYSGSDIQQGTGPITNMHTCTC